MRRVPQGSIHASRSRLNREGWIDQLKVPATGTGMEFEGDFRSYLFTSEKAMEKITVRVDHHVLHTAWTAWQTTLEID